MRVRLARGMYSVFESENKTKRGDAFAIIVLDGNKWKIQFCIVGHQDLGYKSFKEFTTLRAASLYAEKVLERK